MPQIHDLPPEEDNNINASAGDSNDHEIEYELQSLIEALPEEKQGEFQELLLQVERNSWKGFLPPPEILLAYNDAISNGAERILQMAEKRALIRWNCK